MTTIRHCSTGVSSLALRRLTAQIMIALTVLQPMVSLSDVVADAAAQAANRPNVTTAPNGLQVVNIATPNAAGLSHNLYTTFNVNQAGVILNNSKTLVSTQSAGYINGNASLTGPEARIILNEVTSSSPSTLNGYMEVAGKAADVIVANPNGITCNGCGFINTTRGVLTTGTPQIGTAGNLDGFRVTGGSISVTGGGLNAAGTGQVDLLARAVSVAADINAQNLNIVAGANNVDYASLAATPLTTSGGSPALGIDVSVLGGMYANKIQLVATEAGAGVNGSGTLSAGAGGFSLSSQGDIVLAGHTSSSGDLAVSGGGNVQHTGILYAQGHASLNAANQLGNSGTLAAQGNVSLSGDSISNTGALGAGIDSNGNVLAGQGNLSATATHNLTGTGSQSAGGNLALTGANLNLAGSSNQATSVHYIATGGNIDHHGALTQAWQSVDLSAGGMIDNSQSGGIQAGTSLTLNAASLDNTNGGIGAGQSLALTVGTLSNGGGTLYSARDASLTASSLSGNGTLLADRDLSVTLNGSYIQSSANTIHANRNLDFTLSGDLTNQGDLSAGGSLTLHAANLANQSGATLAGISASITADHAFSNAGNVTADTVNLTADSVSNTGSVFGQDLTVHANSLTNQSTGVMAAGNTLDLYVVNSLSNLDGGLLYSANDLAIAASSNRDANGWLVDPTAAILNSSASIQAGRDLEITATTLDNKRTSVITATQTLSTSTELIQNWDGSWSTSVIGNTYPNGVTTFGDPVTTCDQWGNNCTTTTPSTFTPYTTPYWPAAVGVMPTFSLLNPPNQYGSERRRAVITEQMQDYVVSATPEAQVLAGRDMYLRAGTVNNNASRIEATGNLLADVTTLNNTGYTLYNTTRQTVWHGICSDIQGDSPGHLGNCNSGWSWPIDVTDTITGTNTSLDSVFSGGQTLSLSSVTINNASVGAQGLPAGGVNLTVGSAAYSAAPYIFTAPSGGLYVTHTDPASPYLIETDPRFTQYANFISSDYMLRLLGLDPTAMEKRLGDGFYEQQLVRDQFIALRGKSYLSPYASLDDEFKALLDAGADYARAFNLTPGIALSKEQVASLSRDIVWMEDRVVDGQHVLAPVVYLAQGNAERTSGGVIGGGDNTLISARDINNRGTLAANNDLTLQAQHDIVNDSGTISGKTVNLAAGNDIHIGRATQSVNVAPDQAFTHEGIAGSVDGDNVMIAANRDVTFAGGNLSAGNATVAAGRDLTVGSQTLTTEQRLQSGGSRFDRSATSEQGSSVKTTGDLILVTNHDLTVNGSSIDSGGSLTGVAGNAVNLQASMGHDSFNYTAQDSHVSAAAQGSNDTATASTLHAGGDMTFVARGGDLTLKDAALTSDTGAINLAAVRDVNIGAATEQHYNHDERHENNQGFLSGSSRDDSTTDQYTVQQGSSLSGNTININAGHDLAVTASQIVGTGDVNLAAANNLILDTATETHSHDETHHSSQTGIFTGSGSVTWGNRTLDQLQNGTDTTHIGSTVGSLEGNVTLSAGKAYKQEASSVIAPQGNIDISGQSVDIVAAQNTAQDTQDTRFKQTGLTLAVSNPVLAAAQTAQQMKEAASQTKDTRLQALAAATTGLAAKNAYDAVQAGQSVKDGNLADQAGGINISLSIGSQKSQSHSERQGSEAMGSQVAAGGDVVISATGAGKDSNLTVQGSDISAGHNVNLTADNAINLLASESTFEQHSTNSSSSASVGIGFSLGGGGFGFSLNLAAAQGRGNADGNDVTHNNTRVQAGNQLNLQSGGDTTMKGAVAGGKQVTADIGGNLNIESLQDTHTYTSNQDSSGFSVSIPIYGAGGWGASANFSNEHINSTFASVIEQSGIKAGDGGFKVNVKGNTDLKGAVIASTDQAVQDGMNSLSTGTLTTGDIENKAEYKGRSMSLGMGYQSSGSGSGTGTDQQGKAQSGAAQVPGTLLGSLNGWSATPPAAMNANGSASSTTQSGISGADISVTDGKKQQELTGKDAATAVASLNRDVSSDKDGSNSLAPIFNEQEIKAGFAITGAFTREAGAFLNNRAKEATQIQKALDAEMAKPTEKQDTTKINQLAQQLQGSQIWQPGGTGRMILTAITAAASGDVTGSTSQMIQSAAVNYLQSLGAEQVKHIADNLDSETARTALQGLVGCVGAFAQNKDCGTGAAGAAASVVVNDLLASLTGKDAANMTPEEMQSRENIVTSLIAGITTTVGGNASVSTAAAEIETENNYLIPKQLAQAEAAMTKCGSDVACQIRVRNSARIASAGQDISFTLAKAKCLLGVCGDYNDIVAFLKKAMDPSTVVNDVKSLHPDWSSEQVLAQSIAYYTEAQNSLDASTFRAVVGTMDVVAAVTAVLAPVMTGVNSGAKVESLATNDIRFSQNTVSYNKVDRITGETYTYDDLVQSMKTSGWKGEPVDVVKMPDGAMASMDNTRITAARDAGIKVEANVHGFNDPLPADMIANRRFGDATTWGDALTGRINSQRPASFGSVNPNGSPIPPRITGRP